MFPGNKQLRSKGSQKNLCTRALAFCPTLLPASSVTLVKSAKLLWAYAPLTEVLLGISHTPGYVEHLDTEARTAGFPLGKHPRLKHVRPSGPGSVVTLGDNTAPSLHPLPVVSVSCCRVINCPK